MPITINSLHHALNFMAVILVVSFVLSMLLWIHTYQNPHVQFRFATGIIWVLNAEIIQVISVFEMAISCFSVLCAVLVYRRAKWKYLIAFLVVGMFGGGLYYLSFVLNFIVLLIILYFHESFGE